MRTIQTKPWAKAVASVLFVLSITAVLICFLPVSQLADDGAYQANGYENIVGDMEENLALDYTHRVYDIYVNDKMGDAPSQIPIDEILREPNFFYTIQDKDGKTIDASKKQGDYSQRYELQTTAVYPGEVKEFEEVYSSLQKRYDAMRELQKEYIDVNIETTDTNDGRYRLYATYTEGSYTEEVTITGFIRSPLMDSSSSYIYHLLGETAALYAVKDLCLTALVAGLALSALALLFLTWSAGRRAEYEGVWLRWMDLHLPLEILLILGFLCSLFGVALGGQDLVIRRTMASLYMVLAILLAAGLGLALYLSLVRRIKAKTLWDCLLVRHLLRPLRWGWGKTKTAARRTGRSAADLANKLPLFWMAGLAFLGSLILEALCMYGYAQYWDGAWIFIWLLVKILEGWLVVHAVLCMRELQQGGYQLAQGNLDYQVPLEKLTWSFKTHGEHLNSMRAAIQAAVEDQMKAERMKTELITNVSHDIKTPLTSIVNYVDLLKKQEMPTPEAKEYLEVLDRQSAKLKKLTEDLVEAAKATTGSLPVNFQRTDVNVLLAQSAGEYQERLQKKGLTLLLTPAQGNPAISADGRLLWRVFENLYSNIEKYALEGTRVYLDCRETDSHVTITFRNISATPLNITADELMERFVRGDDSRHTEGSGLGLSIARSLVQLQHGTFDLAIDGDLFKAMVTFPRMPG